MLEMLSAFYSRLNAQSLPSSSHTLFLSCLSDLNRRPPPYHGDALPTELKQHFTVD